MRAPSQASTMASTTGPSPPGMFGREASRPLKWSEIAAKIETDEDGKTVLKDAKTEYKDLPASTKDTLMGVYQKGGDPNPLAKALKVSMGALEIF